MYSIKIMRVESSIKVFSTGIEALIITGLMIYGVQIFNIKVISALNYVLKN